MELSAVPDDIATVAAASGSRSIQHNIDIDVLSARDAA